MTIIFNSLYKNSFYLYLATLIFLNNQELFCQNDFENNDQELIYEMLRTQVDLYSKYYTNDKNDRILIGEADSLAQIGEYDLGIIYLEQVIDSHSQQVEMVYESGMQNTAEQFQQKYDVGSDKKFKFSILSGIDFDRHEFEYNYEQNDSTIMEEISKPYVGLNTEFIIKNTDITKLNLYNSLRYDNEYLRDDYQLSYYSKQLRIIFGGYYNKSFNADYSSYWDQKFQGTYFTTLWENVNLSAHDRFNYKNYSQSDITYTDFYRNYLEGSGEIYIEDWTFYGKYSYDINELLGNSNNDYQQHAFEMGYRNFMDLKFKHSISAEMAFRDYELVYGDSAYSNYYSQSILKAETDFYLTDILSMQIVGQFNYKIYNKKSTFEPDYTWDFLRPTLNIDISSEMQLGLGYELEHKFHKEIEEDGVSSKEQDYKTKGIYASINYFAGTETYFWFSLSYQWRRYPESLTNDLINLYSSRNILSLMLMGYIPIYRNIKLNIMGMYDNDKDIDNDQGMTQSSLFNIEIEYGF